MCSSIVLYLTFISDNSLPFYAWKQEWVYIFYVASITEKKNRYHDLPSCIIMTCDRHLRETTMTDDVRWQWQLMWDNRWRETTMTDVVRQQWQMTRDDKYKWCGHCHLMSSAIVISRHLSLSSHIICHCCLTSSAIIISCHLPLSSHVICHCHLTSSIIVVSHHLSLLSHVICH
jgi:hypothetical protein